MRSILMAMTVDDHVAILDKRPPDEDIEELWETCANVAEDFGLSSPPEDPDAAHWSLDMAVEADSDVHVLLDAKTWPGNQE